MHTNEQANQHILKTLAGPLVPRVKEIHAWSGTFCTKSG